MRLRRLTLRDVRGVTHRDVAFADVGVTVVEGPNEAGKSTMIEAFDLLLYTRADSKASKVRDIMPAGSDVGSEIEAEIICGEWHFTYVKRFNKQAATELTIESPRREHLTGRDAHERVLQILEKNVDVGLMRALRLMQGDDPALSDLAASSTLTTALDRAAGSMDEGTGDDQALIDAVTVEYTRYFTPSHGRPTGELAEARAHFAATRDRHAELRTGLEAIDSEAAALRSGIERRASLQRSLELTRVARADLDEELHEASVAKARLDTADKEVRHAATVATLARRDADDRAELRRQLDTWSAEQQDCAKRVETAKQQSLAAHADAIALTSELEGARTRLAEVRATLASGRAAAVRATQHAELARLGATLETVAEVDSRAEQLLVKLRTNEVDATVAAQAAALDRELAAADAAVAAAVATFSVEPSGSIPVRVHGEVLSSATDFVANEESIVDVEGVVRIRIRRGADADTLAAEAQTVRKSAEALCARYGVPDLTAFAARAQDRADLRHRLGALAERRRAALGAATYEQLTERRAELIAELGESLASSVDIPEAESVDAEDRDDVDLEHVDLEGVAGAERELADLVARAERAAAEMRSKEEAARERASVAMADGARASERATEVQRLLTAKQAELSDADAEAAAVRAEEQRHIAQRECAAARAALEALDLANLDQRRARVENELSSLSEELGGVEQSITAWRTRIEVYRDGSQLDAVQEAAADQEAAEAALGRVTRRADAAALLLATLSSKRQEVRARYVAPFTDRLERLGASVFGESVRFDVDDDLVVRSRTIDGITVAHDALSGGAREQVGLIARLACAMLVDPADGVPVIIDDALGYSDPDRLAAMAEVLAVAGRDAQVIVLTCTPQRYAAVAGATTLAL